MNLRYSLGRILPTFQQKLGLRGWMTISMSALPLGMLTLQTGQSTLSLLRLVMRAFGLVIALEHLS